MSKDQLRKLIKQRSTSFSGELKAKADNIIQDQISELISGVKNVAIYMNMTDEVSTERLLTRALSADKVISSPKCLDDKNMVMAEIRDLRAFSKGYLAIKEPTGAIVAKADIEVIIVPMIAFDKNGGRIGHNRGYYDRYLQDYKGLKIGIAYQYQEVADTMQDEHDIAMDIIVTEQNIYKISHYESVI